MARFLPPPDDMTIRFWPCQWAGLSCQDAYSEAPYVGTHPDKPKPPPADQAALPGRAQGFPVPAAAARPDEFGPGVAADPGFGAGGLWQEPAGQRLGRVPERPLCLAVVGRLGQCRRPVRRLPVGCRRDCRPGGLPADQAHGASARATTHGRSVELLEQRARRFDLACRVGPGRLPPNPRRV